ncbi:isoleucine--tRNA ligase [Candidatus Fermentibacteria bacterium]|nr:isoleucine--tRNA ligase [Candidatus Fermentibacteria bacterium]
MFTPVSSTLSLVPLEHRILKFWEQNRTFDARRALNAGGPPWSFLDGPITANNPMGVHHAWGRTYKDIFQRYRAMRGFHQRYQNGFDCQGLWVEVEVEKALGFTSKRDIESFGVAQFVQRCKERVFKYSRIQTNQSIRLGYWMDWANSYYTMSDENNYTIWMFLRRCHDRGWIYQGHDVMPWCPRCSCALSEHEIATEGYQELTHASVFLLFPLIDRPDEHLLVWTTTPWTLSSNVAAAVNPELTYLKVRQDGKILYLSSGAEQVLGPGYEVLGRISGADMAGWAYRGPFDELPAQAGVAHRVILWDAVSDTEGTGIVHIAPGCGKEDFMLSAQWDLQAIAPLDEYGVFQPGFEPLTGGTAAGVAPQVFGWLRDHGILYRIEEYTHRYPVCWRCGSELVFRLVDEWFIAMDELRPRIMAVTQRITWMPSFGLERELDWLRNMHDWCISKKRFWGLALPIFVCPEGHFHVIGSEEELRDKAVEGWEAFVGHSPHRPWIDAVRIACPTCEAPAVRIPDVSNPWLDAGIVPYSTMGYRRGSHIWATWFPPAFITECFPGQFRNWFYSLLAMSTVMEDREPFKVVLGHGSVRDEHGEEMHKSKGNAIWFDDAAETVGVETMRWVFARQNPYANLNFGFSLAAEAGRRLATLWNSYAFFVTYANLDGVDPATLPPAPPAPSLLDRWMQARLAQLARDGREAMEGYELAGFIKAAETFLDDLSNWYIRRSRRRFWKSQSDLDKQSAYTTLYHTLLGLCRILAPVIPFLTEEIYQNLAPEGSPFSRGSVHLEDYPMTQPSSEDEDLAALMAEVHQVVTLGHAARNKAGIKVRQPLAEIVVRGWSPERQAQWVDVEPMVRDELNVKEIRLAGPGETLAEPVVKLNFAKVGPRLGPKVKLLAQKAAAEAAAAAGALGKGVPWQVDLEGESVTVEPEEAAIQFVSPPGWVFVAEGAFEALLNTTVTEALAREGAARDLVRHIQSLRKDAGLEISDRIKVTLGPREAVEGILAEHGDYIAQEVLATKIEAAEPSEGDATATCPLSGMTVTIGLHRAPGA